MKWRVGRHSIQNKMTHYYLFILITEWNRNEDANKTLNFFTIFWREVWIFAERPVKELNSTATVMEELHISPKVSFCKPMDLTPTNHSNHCFFNKKKTYFRMGSYIGRRAGRCIVFRSFDGIIRSAGGFFLISSEFSSCRIGCYVTWYDQVIIYSIELQSIQLVSWKLMMDVITEETADMKPCLTNTFGWVA